MSAAKPRIHLKPAQDLSEGLDSEALADPTDTTIVHPVAPLFVPSARVSDDGAIPARELVSMSDPIILNVSGLPVPDAPEEEMDDPAAQGSDTPDEPDEPEETGKTGKTGEPDYDAEEIATAESTELETELESGLSDCIGHDPDARPAGVATLTLDEDPDTSLVGSIYLHMLSEHDVYFALGLVDDEAIEYHQQLHEEAEAAGLKIDHASGDWRFRPGRALANSLYNATLSPTCP